MVKCKHLYYFDIDTHQFSCYYDTDYKKQPFWYSSLCNENDLFEIDVNRGFRTPEACESYIKHRVKQTAKKLLKALS